MTDNQVEEPVETPVETPVEETDEEIEKCFKSKKRFTLKCKKRGKKTRKTKLKKVATRPGTPHTM